MPTDTITMTPIGVVSSPRTDLSDDDWGSVESTIIITSPDLRDDALLGLDTFSHLDVVFYFNRVTADDIEHGARRPRGRQEWPLVGILAQRAKARPNRIGVSCCRLISVNGREIRVQGLDAINHTPVLDVKPCMREFQPIGDVTQPAWSHELMKDYY
ncbi:MAG: SAM-dependent methyltransferase [Acidobacteriaceae bacterium]|jgi:tRNA-Thr(GGU) m(6)t(6)A37 methyltransferase TsaA|nr:SAM-dependent methyltransferase [Acidobacteriaceae bacterium]